MRATNSLMSVELGDFQLGNFQVLPSQSLLRKISPEPDTAAPGTEDIHVEPKVMAVLERLAAEPLQVVSRNTLLDDVWSGTVVTDEVVTRCISELRHALGDSSRSPSYIQNHSQERLQTSAAAPSDCRRGCGTRTSHRSTERPSNQRRFAWAAAHRQFRCSARATREAPSPAVGAGGQLACRRGFGHRLVRAEQPR